ncbi:phosphonate transporter [Cupriavidus basilensis]|uniref:phosphonate transporter n=1 Tax=Cupriavidus basilensis TaxID=68895 RepID=UPI0039F6BDC9
MRMSFSEISLEQLDSLSAQDADALPFGTIGFASTGIVERYNATESRLAGLSPERVLGRHFFAEVAICMNNFMVAQRFEDADSLDATIDYVLTLRMRPTPVKLRLLKSPGRDRRYVLIQR